MPEDERPMRITEIVLRPRIRLRGRGSEKVPRLVRIAHEECFIANSLAVDVRIEPTVDVED
ncbi:OsmC family protein (fragment) [Nostocoides japonicum T1-X7]|uniref:OsmC family protein n=2 Tax=Nostocoides japonicum TaxID=99481 RepID=A0A077LTD9_9MICO